MFDYRTRQALQRTLKESPETGAYLKPLSGGLERDAEVAYLLPVLRRTRLLLMKMACSVPVNLSPVLTSIERITRT